MRGRPPKAPEKREGHHAAPGLAVVPDLAPIPAPLAHREPPEGMEPAASDAWRMCIADMAGNKTLRESDLIALNVLCEAVADHEAAVENIRKYGRLVKGPKGPMPNPMLKEKQRSATTIRQYSDILGLNPMARIRGNLLQLAGQSQALDVRERLIEILTARGA